MKRREKKASYASSRTHAPNALLSKTSLCAPKSLYSRRSSSTPQKRPTKFKVDCDKQRTKLASIKKIRESWMRSYSKPNSQKTPIKRTFSSKYRKSMI